MVAESQELIPDLRPRPRRPRSIYLVAIAYICTVGFFVGGGFHQLGGFFVFPGFWLWLIGGVSAMFDLSYPERRNSGLVALFAAVALPFGFWWLLVWLTSGP